MKKSPMCVVEWYLGYLLGGGTVIAMAIGVSTLMSDHQNYVRPLVVHCKIASKENQRNKP
jgi:hypothetical protein